MRRFTFSVLSVTAITGISLFFFQNCDGFRSGSSETILLNSYSADGSVRQSSAVSATAISLFRRLAGVTPDLDDADLLEMEERLINGDIEGAADVATHTSEFYNITVKDFATKMSNIEQTVSKPLNDFVATVIGTVRDDGSALNMLTENYYYRAYGAQGVSQNVENDIIRSNNHYIQLENTGTDLKEVLEREDGQKVLGPGGNVQVLGDAAGLMTTRGWMEAHADAGTNRRLIEYAFKIFLCSPIETWASTSYADNRVGPDVGRIPASEYLNKCKSCHSGMDALRPATAYFDFADGFIKHSYTYENDPNPNDPSQLNVSVPSDERMVPSKFRRASDVFGGGFRVKNNDWENYASPTRFGWRSRLDGSGMHSFGELIANSEQFSRCMAQRVFKTVCRRDPLEKEEDMIQNLANDFEDNNYSLRSLFVKVAVQPACIGLSL